MRSSQRTSYIWIFIAVGLVAANLLLLLVARGQYLSGWDILGASEGSFIVAEKGVWEAVVFYFDKSRSFQYWGTANSVLFAVIPGLVQQVAPSIYTPVLVMFLVTIFFWLIPVVALSLDVFAFIAGIAMSGNLLTYLLIGHGYVAVTIPYCLAIPLLLRTADSKLTLKSLLFELIAWAVVFESAFQVYEPGRSVGCLPIIAAISIREVKTARRILWLLVSGVMLYFYSVGSTTSLGYKPVLNDALQSLLLIPEGILVFARALFVEWRVDIPILLPLSFVLVWFLKKNRLFWLMLLGLQVGLMVLLYIVHHYQGYVDTTEALRSRRFVLASFTALLVSASFFAQFARHFSGQRVLLVSRIALLLATLPALFSSYEFYQRPIADRSLPFTGSGADYRVQPERIADAAVLASLVKDSPRELVVLYGLSCYVENSTDPLALAERVALELGPSAFAERVHFIDAPEGKVAQTSRYVTTPFQNAGKIRDALRRKEKFYLAAYTENHCSDDYRTVLKDGVVIENSWLDAMLKDHNAQARQVDEEGLNYFKLYLIDYESEKSVFRNVS